MRFILLKPINNSFWGLIIQAYLLYLNYRIVLQGQKMYNSKYFYLLLLPYLICQLPFVQASLIKTKCVLVEQQGNIYVCTIDNYQWVLFKTFWKYRKQTQQLTTELNGPEQIKERLRNKRDQVFLILVNVFSHHKQQIIYTMLQNEQQNVFIFKKVPFIPNPYQQIRTEISSSALGEISGKNNQEKNILGEALVLIIVLVAVIVVVYLWRKKQLSSNIDKEPADLKEAMMTKIEIQQERNRNMSTGIIRASEPPEKEVS